MGQNVSTSNSKRALELLFIIGAPIIAFAMVAMVSRPRIVTGQFLYDPGTPDWFVAFSAIITHTHVMMVFFRSHLNENIFKRYPIRFVLVPIIVMASFYIWGRLVGIMSLVAFYWDEWHSILQTFGFGRIYDAREGNDPSLGRKLDIGICFVLCLFPHLIMLTFLPSDQRIEGLAEVLMLDQGLAVKYGHIIHNLRYPLISIGLGYMAYYVYRYSRLIKNGYKISPFKIALLGSTCFTAIIIALFYSIADAAHYFNIYHSLQYVFIVLISEVPALSGRFKLPNVNKKMILFFFGIMVMTISLAAGVARDTHYFPFLGNFWILSSLLHFWYDGFIWSVRRSDIA